MMLLISTRPWIGDHEVVGQSRCRSSRGPSGVSTRSMSFQGRGMALRSATIHPASNPRSAVRPS